MSLGLVDLNNFKNYRNNITESLNNKLIGRDSELNCILRLLSKNDYVALSGPAGIGKSRLAVAAIEKYVGNNENIIPLCFNSFSDYLLELEKLEDSKKYIFLIDDANSYKKLDELIKCLKYKNKGNIKVILTIRDYLKNCLDTDFDINFYEINSLKHDEIKQAIFENTPIKNDKWLEKIAELSKGNIRFAYMVADIVVKEKKNYSFLFDVKAVMDKFYKEQISKISYSKNLVITLGILAFFKTIYLEQLFYIAPVLKLVGMSKQEFLDNVNTLIDIRMIDEYLEVVKISNQCFKDYLLIYNFYEKKYLSLKDIIAHGYKYYKNRIIETLNIIFANFYNDDLHAYVAREIIDALNLINDVDLKHDMEGRFGQIIQSYVINDFKVEINEYNDKKDIDWLIRIFEVLAKTEYSKVALEGAIILLNKTKGNKEKIYKSITKIYSFNYDNVQLSFNFLNDYVTYIKEKQIKNDCFFFLVSSYLKFPFENVSFDSCNNVFTECSYYISDSMIGIIEFRKNCWDYIFSYDSEIVLKTIIAFIKTPIEKDTVKIITSDIKNISEYISKEEYKEIVETFLYLKFENNLIEYGLKDVISPNEKYLQILKLILDKKCDGELAVDYLKRHNESVSTYYLSNKEEFFAILNNTNILNRFYLNEVRDFLIKHIELIDEFNSLILDIFIKYDVNVNIVLETAIKIIDLKKLYEIILTINDDSIKDEYLYNFYVLVNNSNESETYGFKSWLKSKMDEKTTKTYSRSVLNLKNIASKSEIGYLKLVKILFKKKEYNQNIAHVYLQYLFLENNSFDELLTLDKNLAIEIYEFITKDGYQEDLNFKLLKKIVLAKRNYLKTFAHNFLNAKNFDVNGLSELIFENDNYKLFFDECIEIVKKQDESYIPINFQMLVCINILQPKMNVWIDNYINSEYKDNNAMEALFTILAGVDLIYIKKYIVNYYKKGKDQNVLKYVLLKKLDCFPMEKLQDIYLKEIKKLESLKNELLNYDNLELINFINSLITRYKKDIKDYKISQVLENVDSDLLLELKELDTKTAISLKDAFDLYLKDENFRKMLSSGYCKYTNGCFVSNDNTKLKFEDVFKNRKISGIKVHPLQSEKEKYENHLSSLKLIHSKFETNKQLSLDECLCMLFKEKNWKTSDFEEETYLSRDFYSKILNNKKNKMNKETIVKILIGLKIDKYVRDYIMELNGTQLSIYDEMDVIYSYLLDAKVDIDTADDLLKDLGKDGF